MPVLFYSAPNKHATKPTRSCLHRLWSLGPGTVSGHRVGAPEMWNECKLKALPLVYKSSCTWKILPEKKRSLK